MKFQKLMIAAVALSFTSPAFAEGENNLATITMKGAQCANLEKASAPAGRHEIEKDSAEGKRLAHRSNSAE